MSVYDPASYGPLEISPTQRAAALPQTYDDVAACKEGCRGLPTVAYLGCVAACDQGVNIPHGERLPAPWPSITLPDLSTAWAQGTGLVKWIVVGIGLLVVYQVVR